MTKRICDIESDEASTEVVRTTVEQLEWMKLGIALLRPLTGQPAIDTFGDSFPPEARDAVDQADCTLFGSTSGLSGGLAYLRWGKKTFANYRPTRYVTGMRSPLRDPEGIDFVIVRENLEGLYPGREGDIADLAPLGLRDGLTGGVLDTSARGKYAVRIITEENTRNVCRAACQLALKRRAFGNQGKVTVAAKYSMLAQSDELFRRIAEETVAEYPGLTFQQLIIDNFAQQMIANPHQFDVVVMPNEHGDVMADGAAALAGGLGLAPSACIGRDYAYFEPVHGTAPDIVGMNIINPTAMLLSAKWMLDYLGFEDAAARLEQAVYAVYAAGKHLTPDQGGSSSTTEFCAAVRAGL